VTTDETTRFASGPNEPGVAFWADVGGFVAGIVLFAHAAPAWHAAAATAP
jgi:membrane associated rhomboid family serine protease